MIGRTTARRLAHEATRRSNAPVATRAAMLYSSLQAAGSLQATYRSRHVLLQSVPGVRLTFANRTVATGTSGTDGSAPNAITVKATLRVGPTLYPLFFGGKRSVVLDVDGAAMCDPLMVPLAAGTELLVHTNVSVADTAKQWPLGLAAISSATVEGAGGGKNEGRKLDLDTSDTGVFDPYSGPMYHPIAILAAGGTDAESWAGFGDSILQGYNAGIADASFAARGFLYRGVGFLNLGRTGETADGFNDRWRRNGLASACTRALVHYGTNDLYGAGRTLQQTKDAMTAMVATLRGMGMTAYVCTLCPRTTSGDAWLTTTGQTVGAAETNRLALNDWLRTGGLALAGAVIVDTAAAVEVSGGKWYGSSVVRSGTATGGSTGTLLDSGLAAPSYSSAGIVGYEACLLRMTSGANNGVARQINGGSSGSATCAAFPSAIAAGDTYDILEVATFDGIHPTNRAHGRMMGAL